MRQKAVTEPSPKLREQFAWDYAKALEDESSNLRKGAVDAVDKTDKLLEGILSQMTSAAMYMSDEWEDSHELMLRLKDARDIIVELRQKMREKQVAFRAER